MKQNVSNRDRSNSSFRHRKNENDSTQQSSQHRSDSSSAKKRKCDSPPSKDSDKDERNKGNESTGDKCPTCSGIFDKDDSAVHCGCCTFWFHAKCQDLTEPQITAFKILGDKAAFFCKNCNAGAKELYRHSLILKERIDNAEKEIETVKSNQKTNTAKIKTLESIHAKIRVDVDVVTNDLKSAQTSIKTLQNESKTEFKDKLAKNTESIDQMKTKLNSVEDNIIKRVESMIDAKVDEKMKTLKAVPEIPDINLDEVINKKLDEKLSDERGSVHTTINRKVTESVANANFPQLPVADMEVDGENPNRIKVPRTFASAVQQVSKEMDEIQRRKLQLVFINLEEAGSADADKKMVQDILDILEVYPEVTDVTRIGRPSRDKPRLIRVSLQNLADKRTILSRATKLRDIPHDHKYAKVYIKPNLTPQQQEASKNLHLQLKAVRLKHPNTTYKINKGQIVIVPDHPQA